MLKVIHTVETWFGSNDELLNYFETKYTKNTIGTFKVQASVASRNNGLKTQADVIKLIAAIGNTIITAIVTDGKAKILNTLPFSNLEKDTRDELLEGVCDAIQHTVLNNQIWEKLNSSSVTTPNFTLSTDMTAWLLQSDMFGMFAKSAIKRSGINEYEWMDEDVVFENTHNGNIKVIGKVDVSKIKELKYV